MYDKAISLKVRRTTAMMFTDKELNAVGKLHMMESLTEGGHEVDNITQYEIIVDRDNQEHEYATFINVRATREC